MPLPELNLSLGLTENNGSVFYAGDGAGEIIVRTDSALKQHTISILISEEKAGTVNLNTSLKGNDSPLEIEIPTYKMIISDDKTNEKEIYQVTRDTYLFKEQSTKKSFWSFLGLKFLSVQNFLFDTLSYEPQHQKIETFEISKYRKLTHDVLTYTFQNEEQTIQLYAGDINTLKLEKGIVYFIIVDQNMGKRLIGDILYREKFLKLSPKVELSIVKRKLVSKAVSANKQGKIDKIIYI
jgi:hypothetical protein